MKIKNYALEMAKTDTLFKNIIEKNETVWINEKYLPFDVVDSMLQLIVSDKDIADAEERLKRFAPYIEKCFPETAGEHGLIESPLKEIEEMKKALIDYSGHGIDGRLLLKMDSHLAIAGSIKARGGIYEVLKHAEELAIENGLITENDSYERFADDDLKKFFADYTVQVGSTGNLGLSIGIMSAFLGFRVKVHMSADAKEWKKELLRSKGVEVIEYSEDYSKAVSEGRRISDQDEKSYFVDDEYSVPLFLGYAVAASRLQKQLEELNVTVDREHPLIVYIPCGVGGAPGGVCYGLKRLYRDNVHVFFCEPTLYPSVLLGMATDRYEKVSVTDFGLGGISAADGLACGSPSGFVTRIDRNILSGDFTVEDYRLFDYLRLLEKTENILIEPSSCAAFKGVEALYSLEECREYIDSCIGNENMKNATHICWATGGRLVPDNIWEEYLNTY